MNCKKAMVCLVVVIALALPLGAFAQMQMNNQSATKSQDAKTQHYKLTGTVKSVDAKGHSLVVQHGDIPGFMAAMTMSYNMAKTENLDKISAGDQIQADIAVTGNDTHLENVKVTNHAGKDK